MTSADLPAVLAIQTGCDARPTHESSAFVEREAEGVSRHLPDPAVTPPARKAGAKRAGRGVPVRLKTSGLGRASLVAVQNSAPFWERHGFRAVPPSER